MSLCCPICEAGSIDCVCSPAKPINSKDWETVKNKAGKPFKFPNDYISTDIELLENLEFCKKVDKLIPSKYLKRF